MTRPAERPRTSRVRAAAGASALSLALALSGCGAPRAGAPADPTGAPVTVVHTSDPLDSAVAAVVARHLRHRGHPVTLEDAGDATPWSAAAGDTVAVVDTLRLALQADPAAVLPPEPEDAAASRAAAAPTPSESSLEPIDPSAPARVPATGSATPSPTPLASGLPAADADAAQAVVDAALSRVTAGADAAAPTPAASRSAATPTGPSPRVLADSAGTLRLAAVVTATTASREGLDSIDDLDGRCGDLTLAVPAALAAAVSDGLLAHRLDDFAGCRPADWRTDAADVGPAVVADAAQVGLTYRTDPDIPPNGLVLLEDPDRVLPEGRIAVVGERETLDDDAQSALGEVMDRLDDDGIAELARLTEGGDALPADEAAQYWLVSQRLEDAPEDWVVPADPWF